MPRCYFFNLVETPTFVTTGYLSEKFCENPKCGHLFHLQLTSTSPLSAVLFLQLRLLLQNSGETSKWSTCGKSSISSERERVYVETLIRAGHKCLLGGACGGGYSGETVFLKGWRQFIECTINLSDRSLKKTWKICLPQ